MVSLYDYPKYYEMVFGERDIQQEVAFLVSLLKKHSKIKVSSILDVACGSGIHLAELAKLGFEVAGLDSSPKMIEKLKEGMIRKPNFIAAYMEDMSSFTLPRKFDICICMLNSLEILTENEQFISHFESIAKCLNLGGLYIIELDSPAFILSLPLPNTKVIEHKKRIKSGDVVIDVVYRRFPFDLLKFVEKNELILNVNDKGKILRIIDDSPVRRLIPSDIDLFVRLNKRFELVTLLGGFDFNITINDKSSRKMVVVLRRI